LQLELVLHVAVKVIHKHVLTSFDLQKLEVKSATFIRKSL